MAKFPVMVANTGTLSSSFLWLNSPGAALGTTWTINDGFKDHIMPIAATASKFYMHLNNAPGGSGVRTIRVRKNTANDNITTVFNPSDTDISDLTNINTYAAADSLDIAASNVNTTTSSVGTRYALLIESANQILWANSTATLSTTLTRYIGIQDNGGGLTSIAAQTQVMPTSGTFRNLYIKLNSALTSGSYTVTLYKNGSPTAITVTVNNSGTVFSDTANSVSFSAGDTFYYECVPSSPNAAKAMAFGMEFVATTPGEGVLLGSSGAALDTSTYYNTWYCAGTNFFNASETNRQALALDCTFKKLYVDLSVAPGGANTRTLALRKNGGAAGLGVTVSGANTNGSTSANIPIVNGDLINVEASASGAASSILRYGLVFQVGNDGNMFLVF